VGDGLDEPILAHRTLHTQALNVIDRIQKEPIRETIELLGRLIEQHERQGDRYPEGYLNLGIALAAAGDLDKSVEPLRTAVDLYNDRAVVERESQREPSVAERRAEAHYWLGRVLVECEQDFSRAVSELREATEADPDNPAAYYYLGRAVELVIERETRTEAQNAYERYLAFGAPLGHEDEVREFLGSRHTSTR
jgi:tetratricopeptide (TPR) repeat protein